MLFTFIIYTCGWLLSFLKLFNASIKDNTLFGEEVIVRVYGNRVTCARVSRRITDQYIDTYYIRAYPAGLMY